MANNYPNSRFNINLKEKTLIVLPHSLFSAWMLAFLFEGRIFYSIANAHNFDATLTVFIAIIANFSGLVLSGFIIKTKKAAKRLFLFSYLVFIAITVIFFFPPSPFWMVGILFGSILAGACVASWGFFLKSGAPGNERLRMVADMLILSNILMILLNIAAILLSPTFGLTLSILVLVCAFALALKLPEDMDISSNTSSQPNNHTGDVTKLLVFLSLFITIITITSGLMYQVVIPAFSHLEWLTIWYWAIPYIIAILIMRNLSPRINRTSILFVAMGMIGLSFIGFFVLDRGVASYFVINTLMMLAFGVFDLFWWSILADVLDLHQNPAKILGIGLSANVLGVFLGGIIGNSITQAEIQTINSSLVALFVVFIALILLLPLNNYLSSILQGHVFLSEFSKLSTSEQIHEMERTAKYGNLSERESQVTTLLLQGKTYKTIANELMISENTVKYYVKNIYTKFNIKSRTELINLIQKKDIT